MNKSLKVMMLALALASCLLVGDWAKSLLAPAQVHEAPTVDSDTWLRFTPSESTEVMRFSTGSIVQSLPCLPGVTVPITVLTPTPSQRSDLYPYEESSVMCLVNHGCGHVCTWRNGKWEHPAGCDGRSIGATYIVTNDLLEITLRGSDAAIIMTDKFNILLEPDRIGPVTTR